MYQSEGSGAGAEQAGNGSCKGCCGENLGLGRIDGMTLAGTEVGIGEEADAGEPN